MPSSGQRTVTKWEECSPTTMPYAIRGSSRTRGNYDHNAVFTTPFNAPTLRHQLTVDIPIKKAALRVGYLGDYQQAEVNHLKYHTYSHLLLIGLVRPLYR